MAKKSLVKAKEKNSSTYDLVVVESPSKAKTIKKFLGKGYQVVASYGHIKDLPKSKLGIDVKNNFKMDLVTIAGKDPRVEKIQEAAKNAKNIYLAPDPDREGEAIAFHIKEALHREKNIYRVIFNAVTKTAVQNAIKNPTSLNKNMYESQKTRRILDRLVGYKISPLLWDKIQRGISAGRVQSVALRIIVEREDEIKAFKPEQWFSISGEFKKVNVPFIFNYYGETPDKKNDLNKESEVKKILKDIKGKSYKVTDIKKKERKQNPTAPFTTSKIQQEASSKLGFSAKKTMMVAQKLYEGIEISGSGLQGLITYMRTDSTRTEPEAMESLRKYIKEKYGKEFLSSDVIIHKKRGKGKVQDAHEAIRPTYLDFPPELVKKDLDSDQFKLYELIWNKFISSQMSPSVIDQTSVVFECNKHFFKSNGSIIKFPGFRTVYFESAAEKVSQKDDNGENEEISSNQQSLLPDLKEGEILNPSIPAESLEHWTSPPPKFNEASLVKALEEFGIGRPSTYASIISNIQDRGYVQKIENRFMPTELGAVVCKMLTESFPDIMDIQFTAKIEELLDLIEEGEENWKKVLGDFWKKFEVTLETAKEQMKNLKKTLIPTGISCKKCKDGMYFIKWGRNGQFLACNNYPECTSSEDFKRNAEGVITIIPKEFAKDPCPTCKQKMVVKKGKYGRFLACEDYPKCDTTLPYTLDIICPDCKKGKFAEKKSRFGKIFYGCTSYPDCKNALWDMPKKHDCPGCGYAIMCEKENKRDGKHLYCPKCKHKVAQEVEAELQL